jgi:hypothetical protein
MQKQTDQMMTAGIGPEYVPGQNVGKPGDRLPVIKRGAGERPLYTFVIKSGFNMEIIDNIGWIVIINKGIVQNAAESNESDSN